MFLALGSLIVEEFVTSRQLLELCLALARFFELASGRELFLLGLKLDLLSINRSTLLLLLRNRLLELSKAFTHKVRRLCKLVLLYCLISEFVGDFFNLITEQFLDLLRALNFALLRAEALLHGLQLSQLRRHISQLLVVIILHGLELSLILLPLILVRLIISQLHVKLGAQLLVFVYALLILDAGLIDLLLVHLAFELEGASLRV